MINRACLHVARPVCTAACAHTASHRLPLRGPSTTAAPPGRMPSAGSAAPVLPASATAPCRLASGTTCARDAGYGIQQTMQRWQTTLACESVVAQLSAGSDVLMGLAQGGMQREGRHRSTSKKGWFVPPRPIVRPRPPPAAANAKTSVSGVRRNSWCRRQMPLIACCTGRLANARNSGRTAARTTASCVSTAVSDYSIWLQYFPS
jgi:hypothetical protein